jgi:hypothetical protein
MGQYRNATRFRYRRVTATLRHLGHAETRKHAAYLLTRTGTNSTRRGGKTQLENSLLSNVLHNRPSTRYQRPGTDSSVSDEHH